MELLKLSNEGNENILKTLWHHSDAVMCCSLKVIVSIFNFFILLLFPFLQILFRQVSIFSGTGKMELFIPLVNFGSIKKLLKYLIFFSDVVIFMLRNLNFINIFCSVVLLLKCFYMMGLPETFDNASSIEPFTHLHSHFL